MWSSEEKKQRFESRRLDDLQPPMSLWRAPLYALLSCFYACLFRKLPRCCVNFSRCTLCTLTLAIVCRLPFCLVGVSKVPCGALVSRTCLMFDGSVGYRFHWLLITTRRKTCGLFKWTGMWELAKLSCRTVFTEVNHYSERDEDRSTEAVFQVRAALEPGGKSHCARGYDLLQSPHKW